MCEMNETQLMRENLQRMMRNENYFSSFFQKSQQQQSQPANPFRKKMFDKKLRRSTVSCGHYNSMQIHQQSKADECNEDSNSRLSTDGLMKISVNHNQIVPHRVQQQLTESPLQIQKTQKMKLAQSRQSMDPNKEKITQIINNFRHELDYLQEKLHAKVDALYQKYQQHDESSQDGEMEFMIESLERIVGFMVENCVNLEDRVLCGVGGRVDKVQQQEQDEEQTQQQNPITMKREIYQIPDDREEQSKENISFGDIQPQLNFKITTNKKSNALRQRPIGEENNINMPNTFFVNDKLHSSEKPKLNNINSFKIHRQQHTKSRREEHPTNRHPPRHNNRRVQTNNKDFHSSKDNPTFSSYNNSNYNSCGVESQPLPVKSIYESVLQQREMRMKLKKRIV